jgi:predicted Zn finger-like uncharacterized protein
MSLITQCPACATMFKVVPDQLRISDGWVRCGQCDEVFDANAHLYPDPDIAPQPTVEPIAPPVDPEGSWAASLRFASQDAEASAAASLPDAERSATDSVVVAEPAAVAETPFFEDLPAPALDPFLDHRPGEMVEARGLAAAFVVPDASAIPVEFGQPRYVQADVKTVAPPDNIKLSFMRKSHGAGFWYRTSVRLVLGGLCAALTCLLGLQLVVQERDRIAATEPASQELLGMVCAWFSCKVTPLRQIESVVIDSSSFTKVRADVYRLNFTLKSTAQTDLAVPALELTLTDMQDQSVIRRVLQGPELGLKKGLLGAGAELSASVPISVKTTGSTERISGYRLLAFYP